MASDKCLCVENSENFTTVSLKQFYVRIPVITEELKQLVTYLRVLDFKQAVIYVRDPVRCASLAQVLAEQEFVTTYIHELMPQKIRFARLMAFKEVEDVSILVTSCCGHAMEFKNVDVVVMFDEVDCPGVYNHRISSRHARKGLVINFIRKDMHMAVLQQVEKLLNISIPALPSELYTSSYIQNEERVTSA